LQYSGETDGLSVFVNIVSWLILLKGIAYIFAPEWLHAMVRNMPRSSFSFLGSVITLLGLYLVFFI